MDLPLLEFFTKFRTKKYCFETKKICNVIFCPPPLRTFFKKNIHIWGDGHPLLWLWSKSSLRPSTPADEDGELLSQQIGKINEGHLRKSISSRVVKIVYYVSLIIFWRFTLCVGFPLRTSNLGRKFFTCSWKKKNYKLTICAADKIWFQPVC